MHPEVRQDSPGACPRCGMALELETPTGHADEAESAELRHMTRRLWVGAVLALPVFLLAMAHLIPALGRKEWVTGETARWLQFALTTAWAFQWRLERSTRSSGCCSARSLPGPP
jgi:Cu+-exporting ATPase